MTLLSKAVQQFNAGAYFACHETLEKLWLKEKGPARDLYKGILQIAVALFHKNRGNRRGAIRILESGAKLLEPFMPVFADLDLSRLQNEALALREMLKSQSNPDLLEHPRIHFHHRRTTALPRTGAE